MGMIIYSLTISNEVSGLDEAPKGFLRKNHPKGPIPQGIPLGGTPLEDALGMAIILIPKITVQTVIV